ncbi:MAG TPA: DUF4252 domain-containing protein [Rhodothermales bacterium]|nr:DUF4252 domain-containing protein [Rhodothermales bacterium]
MKRLSLLLLLLLGVAAPAALAQPTLERDPGYVDVEALTQGITEEPTVEVDVRGALLRLVVASARSDDPELASMLSRLRAIQVRVYKLNSRDRSVVAGRTAEFARRLRSQGWEPFVRVRDEDSRVDMMVRTNGDRITGLVALVVGDDEEAVFLNIVGEVDPEQVGRIGRRFNVDLD